MIVVKTKKQQEQQKYVRDKELKFKNYENCDKANQLDNIIKYSAKMKLKQTASKKNMKNL